MMVIFSKVPKWLKIPFYNAYNDTRLNRNALAMTETELKLIANAAIIGDSKMPKNGYSMPAATGTPRAL